jgi:hypothetical protein
VAGARKCPQGAGRPVGQRLRPAAQLHYRAESARPRANAAANDSASNGPAGLLNANDSTNVSVGTRAHDATRHSDHRAIVRAGRVTDGPGNARRAIVRAGRPTHGPGNARRAIVRAGRPTHGPGNARPANVRAGRPTNHPANVRAGRPTNHPADVRAGRPTNHLASDNARDTARDTVNGTSHTRAYSIAHTRTDNARAYPLKRSYSRGFTSDR